MKVLIKKPSQSKILWMIILFAFLKPAYFGTIASWDKAFDILRILMVLFIAVHFFVIRKKVYKFSLIFLLFSIVPLIVTVTNSGNIFNAFTFCAISFGTVMLVELGVEKEGCNFVDALYCVCEILVYVNLITMILWPEGLYLYETSTGWISDQNWFLGLRNAQTTYLILACIVDVIYWELKPTKKATTVRCICLYVSVFITINRLKIGSGYVGYILMTFLIALIFIWKKICIRFDYVVIGHVIVFFLMTSLGKLNSFVKLSNFIGLLVGRVNTVSARFQIWSVAWEKILSSPIWGHGILNENQLSWLSSIAAGASTTHNTFLDMWYRGGLISFSLFCLVLFYISKNLWNIKNSYQSLYNLCSIGTFAFFVIAQSEGAMSGTTMYILIGLLWKMPDIVRKKWIKK